MSTKISTETVRPSTRRGGTTLTVSASSVAEYVNQVLDGRIVTGALVRAACERHLTDLRRDDLVWDEDASVQAITLFDYFCQYKGRWAGLPLTLLPWQAFVVGSIFGWRQWDSTVNRYVRRFREAYISVGRKNGKSTLAAGIGLKLLAFDDEAGAEIYSVATKRDQARQIWDTAQQIVSQSPMLKQRIHEVKSSHRLIVKQSASVFAPLGRDSDSEHGLNPHGVIIDELHIHSNRDMVDAMETAMGAREEPLILYITTAGLEGETIYTETDTRAKQTVLGSVANDRLFVYLATLDEDDDWTNSANYIKGNPSIGVTIQLADLELERDKAIATPGRQHSFKRLLLNMRGSDASAWLDIRQWDKCIVERLERTGARTLGVDLGGNRDLSAIAIITLDEAGGMDADFHFWIPEERIVEAEERDGVPYQAWVDGGYLHASHGAYRNDQEILDFILGLGLECEVDFDSWQYGYMATQMVSLGMNVVKVPQSFAELGPATEYVEKAVAACTLSHLGNPLMRWMVTNTSIDEHRDGSKKPDKASAYKHRKHIDGPDAMVTGLARLLRQEKPAEDIWGTYGAL